uniref:Secreted protein n=1 Tax=Trichogramma kaykai TaxID=54128 RepID=A0ABD2VVW2_9HYME
MSKLIGYIYRCCCCWRCVAAIAIGTYHRSNRFIFPIQAGARIKRCSIVVGWVIAGNRRDYDASTLNKECHGSFGPGLCALRPPVAYFAATTPQLFLHLI